MTLLRLKAAPFIIIEDDVNKNNMPLLLELLPASDTNKIHFFCFEQSIFLWRNVFKAYSNIVYHEDMDMDLLRKYTSEKCSVMIDSVNQMSFILGWNQCLKVIKNLSTNRNVNKLILVHHTDCLSSTSKLRIHLNHLASAIVSYDNESSNKVNFLLKKGGKVMKSTEMLSYDVKTSTLKSSPIVKDSKVEEEEPQKPLPENLSTFKIEVDQTEKLEKYKLQLPYMSKINEGESKIYYEPDAVDDWDEEDPDDDLDI